MLGIFHKGIITLQTTDMSGKAEITAESTNNCCVSERIVNQQMYFRMLAVHMNYVEHISQMIRLLQNSHDLYSLYTYYCI